MHTNCLLKTGATIASATWTELLFELEILLVRLTHHGRAFVIIHADGPEEIFVQVAVTADGVLRVEAPTTAV